MIRALEDLPCRIERRDPVWIVLEDGTRIATTIWLPVDAAARPVPAIVEMIPYRRRDGTIWRDVEMAPWLAGHGYAYCRVDLRGAGDSDGLLEDEYLPREQEDAQAIIAWLAAQGWCSGAVGMVGISWGGFNALQLAARRPPSLQAIVTLCASDDRFADDVHYMGGGLLTENEMWSSFMLALNATPPDPQIVGARWREMWLARLESDVCWSETWLAHQSRDAYWRQGSVAEDYGAIEVPVYAIGGWDDSYSNAVPRLLAGLKGPRKGLIGPWSHQFPCRGEPGPTIGYLQEILRWWDRWLKGIETGIETEPMLRAWMLAPHRPASFYSSHPGRWVAEPSWPSAGIEGQVFHLNHRRLDAAPAAGPTLSIRSPADAGRDCGRWGGYGGDCPDMAIDQRREDGLALGFETERLAEDLELLGAPVLEIEATADVPRINLTARLCEVAPDGTSTLITWGVLNLACRDGLDRPRDLVPGERFTARLQLNDIGRRVARGARLRLSLATQHWPILWPQPWLGTLSMASGACRLTLPVRRPRPEDADLPPFLPTEITPPLEVAIERPATNYRRVTQDIGSQVQTIELYSDYGRHRITESSIVTDSWCRDIMTIHPEDPLSARLDSEWYLGSVSGPADVEIRSRVTLTGDAETLTLSWRVEASEAGTLVHERSRTRKFPRVSI